MALGKQSLSLCFGEQNVIADKQLPILATSVRATPSVLMNETYM